MANSVRDLGADSSREILYQSEHLTVVINDTGSDALVATFNQMGFRPNGLAYWGSGILERAGVSAVGFVSAEPNWFPPLEMEAAVQRLTSRVSGRHVVTYGCSQGGYGALKYGALLGARTAISFSPQWSINPVDVADFDRRFAKFYDPELCNGERISQGDLCGNNIIFYDQYHDQDRENADRLLGLSRISRVLMPLTDHFSINLISEARVASEFLEICLSGGSDAIWKFRQLVRAARSKSSTYRTFAIQKLLSSQERHGTYSARIFDKFPEGATKTLIATQIQLAVGDLALAEEALAGISYDEIVKTDFARFLVTFRDYSFRYGEKKLVPGIKIRYPSNIMMRMSGVHSYIKFGMKAEALYELEALSKLDGATSYFEFFLECYRLLGRQDLAAAYASEVATLTDLPLADQIRIAFHAIWFFRLCNVRPLVFSHLRKLAELCHGRYPDLMKVAESLIEIGEVSFAEDILVKIKHEVPVENREIIEVHLAQCQAFRDPHAARQSIKLMLKKQSNNVTYWLKLSFLSSRCYSQEAAVLAARNAVRIDASSTEAGLRLSFLLLSTGRRKEAARELTRLFRRGAGFSNEAMRLAALCEQCGLRDLAQHFSETWLKKNPSDINAGLLLCSYLFKANKIESGKVHLLDLIEKIKISPIMPNVEQFVTIIDLVRRYCPVEAEAVNDLARTAYPSSPELITLSNPDFFLANFYVPPDGKEQAFFSSLRSLCGQIRKRLVRMLNP